MCGGVAASIYRKSPRFTNDIDFALVDSVDHSAKELAILVIEKLGYKPKIGFFEEGLVDKKLVNGLVCARLDDRQDRFIGFDFLLPVQSWIEPAVKLAQNNQINFGFACLPTITPESLVLAKLKSLSSNPERIQDLDDLKNIKKDVKLNYVYIKNEIIQLGLNVNDELLTLFFDDAKL